MAILCGMDASPPPAQPKKRGPARKENMVATHIFFPADLLDWAKAQPEGLAPLLRQLLSVERRKRDTQARRS